MNGYTSRILVLIVGAVFALAAGLGQDAVKRLDERTTINEERINGCHVDIATVKANSSATVDALVRIEHQLDRMQDDIDGIDNKLDEHLILDGPFQE